MRRRQGVTLVEVLCAIGIMGIGMLAILVLFPLGAMSMARALMDDRTGTIAWNADSLARALDYHNEPAYQTTAGLGPNLGPLWTPPNMAGFPNPPAPGQSDPTQPGYPVFIDPYFNYAGPGSLAALTTPFVNPDPANYLIYPTVRRVTPPFIMALPAAARLAKIDELFMFKDDLGFHPSGFPKEGSDGKYSWAYMLRRKQSTRAYSTELTVIVYHTRPVEVPVAEDTYQVEPGATKDATEVVISWVSNGAGAREKPPIRRGSWLYDGSPRRDERPPGSGVFWGSVNGEFYRVMDVTDETLAGRPNESALRIEVQPPLKTDQVSQMTFLLGAVQVFERGAKR